MTGVTGAHPFVCIMLQLGSQGALSLLALPGLLHRPLLQAAAAALQAADLRLSRGGVGGDPAE